MTSGNDAVSTEGLTALFRRELRLDAPRARSIARISAGTAFAVAVSMVFQIPLVPYVAYVIFLLSQEDTASTLMSAIAGLVAATLAVALSVLFYVFDASEPALRIPLLALGMFLGTFLSRTSTLGPIAFLAGFVLMLSQHSSTTRRAPSPSPISSCGFGWLSPRRYSQSSPSIF